MRNCTASLQTPALNMGAYAHGPLASIFSPTSSTFSCSQSSSIHRTPSPLYLSFCFPRRALAILSVQLPKTHVPRQLNCRLPDGRARLRGHRGHRSPQDLSEYSGLKHGAYLAAPRLVLCVGYLILVSLCSCRPEVCTASATWTPLTSGHHPVSDICSALSSPPSGEYSPFHPL